MARSAARKGLRRSSIRSGIASQRRNWPRFTPFDSRHYWMAESEGLFSVALSLTEGLAITERATAGT